MKKLIALTLVIVCLGFFSLGCGEAKNDPAPATTTPAAGSDAAIDNGAADDDAE